MEGVRKVVKAAPEAHVVVTLPTAKLNLDANSPLFQPTFDDSKPYIYVTDPNQTHPLRQKEVIAKLKNELPDDSGMRTHTLLAVRRLFDIDADERFVYQPLHASPQYSAAFVDWLLQQFKANPKFFWNAKDSFGKK